MRQKSASFPVAQAAQAITRALRQGGASPQSRDVQLWIEILKARMRIFPNVAPAMACEFRVEKGRVVFPYHGGTAHPGRFEATVQKMLEREASRAH